jgi:hypothetical protein
MYLETMTFEVGEERKMYTILVVKPEGKRLLGRPRRRWEDLIRMDLREIGCPSPSLLRVGTCGGIL